MTVCSIGRPRVLGQTIRLHQHRTSHIGARAITVPDQVTITRNLKPDRMQEYVVKGPQGTATLSVPDFIRFSRPKQSTQCTLSISGSTSKAQQSAWGLHRSLLQNAVTGVSVGHTVTVSLKGVGYRATLQSDLGAAGVGKALNLKLGYPHPIVIPLPPTIQATVESPTEIVLSCRDKQVLGSFAAQIRSLRPPEPYNGKGVFVGKEEVRRKEIKKK